MNKSEAGMLRGIVKSCFEQNIKPKAHIENNDLETFFNQMFDEVSEAFELHPAWVCLKCEMDNGFYGDWGTKPQVCNQCGGSTYLVGNFQARASIHGSAFEIALEFLLGDFFGLPIERAPHNTKTHDFTIGKEIAIEAKGSAKHSLGRDSEMGDELRAGLFRSDTKKKAFANAKEWRGNNEGLFFILSNAVPEDLQNYENDTITAVYDTSKSDQVYDFVEKTQEFLGKH